MKKLESIEPKITEIGNTWLKNYGIDYKLEQEPLNKEVDSALKKALSKSGGKGGNRPDAKIMLEDEELNYYPILIEYKGHKGKLVKLYDNEEVANIKITGKEKGEPNYANISGFAVNGAVHYANAILEYTSYTEVIAIGMTGYKDELDRIIHEIGVYYVSKENYGIGQKIASFTDFSFLTPNNFNNFIKKVKQLKLTDQEINSFRQNREQEIEDALTKVNERIYHKEQNISALSRIHLVAASIISTIGIPGPGGVSPLTYEELRSSSEYGNSDGDILMRKITSFLQKKGLPQRKQQTIINSISQTITNEALNRPKNGITPLKEMFIEIVDDLGKYYKVGLDTDFTGKLFNTMFRWLNFVGDDQNDVVLTPSYVSTLMARLARVNKDSYVWDFAMGSGGLLIASMNIMLDDAKETLKSPDQLKQKEMDIKVKQILGIEVLPEIYMLAVLNMILMGDGSSNIINDNAITNFVGNYGFGKENEQFPATAFLLNPPYSADGNGMVFVQKALAMMQKGYAAVIVQSSAGSGRATDYNKNILENNTLLASIKMPLDIFKTAVQTYIYVFRVGEKHEAQSPVKFIDFSNDGYSRSKRKKAKASANLKDTSNAKGRYEELVNLVKFGASKLNIFTEKEYYEGTIDPKSGKDWNQAAPIDTTPHLADFKKTVADYLSWEVSQILKNQTEGEGLKKLDAPLEKMLKDVEWGEFRIGDLFEIKTGSLIPNNQLKTGLLPRISAKSEENGILGYYDTNNLIDARHEENFISVNFFGTDGGVFYHPYKASIEMKVHTLKIPNYKLNIKTGNFIVSALKMVLKGFDYGQQLSSSKLKTQGYYISLPSKQGKPDFTFMEEFITKLQAYRLKELQAYLTATGLIDYELSIYEQKILDTFMDVCHNKEAKPSQAKPSQAKPSQVRVE